MRKAIKTASFCLFLGLLISGPVFSNTPANIPIDELTSTMDKFAENLAFSLPFNSGMGLNWAEPHIKNFPHFGVGFSLGFTTMELEALNKLIEYFSPALPGWVVGFGGFPLPGYLVEARLGGIGRKEGFPNGFDVGIKFGILPMKFNSDKFDFERLDYIVVGGDARLSILEDKGMVPGISVGVGFSYMKGGLGMSAGNDTSIDYYDPQDLTQTGTLTLGAPKLDLDWSTASLDFKAQIAKTFFVVTPYFGFGASNGWSKAGYSLKTDISDTGGNLDAAIQLMQQFFGLKDFNKDGFGASSDFTGWTYRLYGGIGFNIKLFKIELTGLYNIRNNNYGATIGARFQM